MRLSKPKAIRATAWAFVVAGVAAPLVRKRLHSHALATQTVAFCAPVALCVAVRRSRTRDVATCALQMWAYLAAYKSPHDDVEGQASRVHIDYPIVADRILGLGELPTLRLQRALARVGVDGRPEWTALDRALVWTHWSWFAVPHVALAYLLVRHLERFDRAAVLIYAVFDVGAMFYWVVPTAPPWYAAEAAERGSGHRGAWEGETDVANRMRETLAVRRMMVEYGEHFWGDRWTSLYSVFGGNPLAAMPSLHFATTLMAALLLTEASPLAGALGFSYAAALALALVYLGEHYAVDLLGAAALTSAVRRSEPHVGPLIARLGRAVAALEARAHAAG